ncbi:MAG: hypothetical protein FWH22_02050 [Fibromonadales bacterium]|nr:hypothetical protein [Fibromonadales bacterium]
MLKFHFLLAVAASLFLGCLPFDNPDDEYVEHVQKCGDITFDPEIQKCENSVLLIKCGDNWYNPNIDYCVDSIVKDKNELFESSELSGYKELIDERDGKAYNYVEIGTQTWMAENMRFETPNTKCYDDNEKNCELFGKMYTWNTAITVCPVGWHLPSEREWRALLSFVEKSSGCSNCAGTKLKANSTLWVPGRSGTDDFGFAALPGGYYRPNYLFLRIAEEANFWSATEGSVPGSVHFIYFGSLESLSVDGLYKDDSWVYVRCIKD